MLLRSRYLSLFCLCLPLSALAAPKAANPATPSTPATHEPKPLVTLNFKDMDINLLVETVSEVTKKTFIVDPRVKANVTVVSAKPMNSDEVYQVFLSILSVNGFTAVPSGNVIKILPDNIAKSENSPVLGERENAQGDELVTQIVQLGHVSAAQLIPLLRPLIPQQGHLVAYPANNTLIVSDKADNVARLLKVIHRIDQASNDDTEVIMLGHASAAEIARLINTLEQKNSAAAAAGGGMSTASVVADERTNSVLISGDKSSRLRLRTLIAHLDTPLKSVGNTQVVYLRYAHAKDLVTVLKGISDTVSDGGGTSSPTAAGASPTPPTSTPTGNKDKIKTTIQADENTNSLIITAAPDVLRSLQSVIKQLDIRRAQVLVEAVIAEVSNDTARDLGVQWLLGGGSSSVTPIGVSNLTAAGTGILDIASAAYNLKNNSSSSTSSLSSLGNGGMLGLGRVSGGAFNFGVLIKALASDTESNILSTPSLLTLDNQSAEIVVGQNVPFVTGQYSSTGSATGVATPFQTIQRQDVGLKLKVKPQINEGDSVKLDIEQEVSSLTRSSVATADIVTNKRTIKTSVIIEDKNMVVLGGLIDEDLEQTIQKVPVLGDLPIIGSLFRSQNTKKVKRNLMVFLHPVIVRDAATEQLVTQEKYGYMRIKQLEQKADGQSLLPKDVTPVMQNLNDFMVVYPSDNVESNFDQRGQPQLKTVLP
jgi:general secretion pathway protein D